MAFDLEALLGKNSTSAKTPLDENDIPVATGPAPEASDPTGFDMGKLMQDQEAADKKNRLLAGIGAIGDAQSHTLGWGNAFLGRSGPAYDHSGENSAIEMGKQNNPMAKYEKLLSSYRQAQQGKLGDMELKKSTEMADPNSGAASSLRGVYAPIMQKLGMDPSMLEGRSASEIRELLDKPISEAQRSKDREATLAAQLGARADARSDRNEARAFKEKELSSTQAKQRGLYESGSLAEQQYNDAVKNGDYDPSESFQPIDSMDWAPNFMKSDGAIKSKAAESAWIESFLRDASGAAIPPSERGAYAKDFFPQAGDTKDVISNKAALRAQKMENARMAAGGERKGALPSERMPSASTVRMKAPDGSIREVPSDQVKKYEAKGAKRV